MSLFCYQCQEAAKGTGCSANRGVCGIDEPTINFQDLNVHLLKGMSFFATRAAAKDLPVNSAAHTAIRVLFSTITNANFDKNFFYGQIKETIRMRDQLRASLENVGVVFNDTDLKFACKWSPMDDSGIESTAFTIDPRIDAPTEDTRSLRALALYGLKGMAAYAEHALNLGFENEAVNLHILKTLDYLLTDDDDLNTHINIVLETGKFGVEVMALLDKANTTTYGNPEITQVNIGVRNNPGILVSGHDLKDLEELLEQTKNTGVDVYTHSEMLPAHYYPAFRKYSNFVGNYGNAWWKQKEEFQTFNGPILFTTNCLVPPSSTSNYSDKVYTTGAVGFPGFKYIKERKPGQQKDFTEIIEHAKMCQPPSEIESGFITGGFAHNQVIALADKIVEAVKSGAIRKFFVMAGCDGRHKERNYYSEFAQQLPNDTVILTAGCAKYRYNKLPLGDIGGIPRVLDAGQCNDSYSLAIIALKLKEVFGLDNINDLPIVYNIAWYEQKAVIVLLALLHLGVKNIHLGPTLPAFLSPNVTKILVDTFGIGTISSVEEDIHNMANAPTI
jgi:hydroxylamine reductase